jgi:hypothetical protein
MIGLCLNPECNEELRYLRQGSVYAWEDGVAPEHSEFFWLCPACSLTFQVACDENGKAVLWPKRLRIGPNRTYSRVRRVFRELVRPDASVVAAVEPDFPPKIVASRLDAA